MKVSSRNRGSPAQSPMTERPKTVLHMITGHLLARNVVWNLLETIARLLVATALWA
jgi:hypothetical protein